MTDETSGQDFSDIDEALAGFGRGDDGIGEAGDSGETADAGEAGAAGDDEQSGPAEGGQEFDAEEMDAIAEGGQEFDAEEMDAIAEAQRAMAEARERLAEVPAEVVVTNHVMGLYELGAIHLSATPPDLRQAALAIDSVACLVDGLGDRLGPDAGAMRDALNNIRLAFVQIKSSVESQGPQQQSPQDPSAN